MKKIAVLLAVILADFILLKFVAADDHLQFMPATYFPYLLLFLTMMTTLFLFYEDHLQKAHQQMRKMYHGRVDPMFQEQEPGHPTHLPVAKLATAGSHEPSGQQAVPDAHASVAKSFLLRKKETSSADLQYQFVELLMSQMREMAKEGLHEEQIVEQLRSQHWDPQVIYMALSRLKHEGSLSS